MEDDLKRNIDVAAQTNVAEAAVAEWLCDVIHQLHGEPTSDGCNYLPGEFTRHEVLCEITRALTDHDAAALFKELRLQYKGGADIVNLPAPDGRYILDYAYEHGAPALAEEVQKAAGGSFPVKLSTDAAQELFFEWHICREDLNHYPLSYLNVLVFEDENTKAEDLIEVITAATIQHAIDGDWENCSKTSELLQTHTRLSGRDLTQRDRDNLKYIINLAAMDEKYEIAAYFRDFTNPPEEKLGLYL